MQILLLLSALLSAMTGGLSSTGGEAVRVDRAEAQVIAPALAPQRAGTEAQRPAQPCTVLRRSADRPRAAARPAPQNAPLQSVCLIE